MIAIDHRSGFFYRDLTAITKLFEIGIGDRDLKKQLSVTTLVYSYPLKWVFYFNKRHKPCWFIGNIFSHLTTRETSSSVKLQCYYNLMDRL